MLLKFVTSYSRAPLLGFKYLQPAFTIHKVASDAPLWAAIGGSDVEQLPSASTCYNTIKDLRFLTGAGFVTMSKRGWYMSKTTSLRQGNLSSPNRVMAAGKQPVGGKVVTPILLAPSPYRFCFNHKTVVCFKKTTTTVFWDQSPWLHQSRQRTLMKGRAEFVSRSPRVDSKQKMWNSPKTAPAWTNSLVKGYYAKLGEDFSQESTRKAIVELAASPEFTNWMIEHTDRIKLLPRDDSSDESVGSKSSSDNEDEESHSWFRLF
ncbi:hypothetical protein GOBAR_DD09449 [Gossypium barbadense]|nr:hypothetical protein GOBAR_DD09449 [Gossypium barbadense]